MVDAFVKPLGTQAKDYCGSSKLMKSKHSLSSWMSESLKGTIVFENMVGLSYCFLSAGASVIELTLLPPLL